MMTDKPRLTKAQKKLLYGRDYPEPIKTMRKTYQRIAEITNSNTLFKKEELRDTNMSYFNESRDAKKNVYGSVVEMIEAIPRKVPNEFVDWFLEDFRDWLTDSGLEEDYQKQFLTEAVQGAALKSCPIASKSLLSEIFNIPEDEVLTDVKRMRDDLIKKKDYVDAAALVKKYGLIDVNTFKDLVLPLVLFDKMDDTYKLIRGQYKLQFQLVQFLDSLVCKTEREVEEILHEHNFRDIANIAIERFLGKKLDALIRKMCSIDGLEDNLTSHAPMYMENAQMKHIRHQIDNRNKGGDDCLYYQHMETLKKCSPRVREKILFHIWNFKTEEAEIDAISWAIFLGADNPEANELPGLMKDFFRSPDGRLQKAKDLLRERKEKCVGTNNNLSVTYKDQSYPIQLITTEEGLAALSSQLAHFDDDLSSEITYVGFDSEWYDGVIEHTVTKMALLQLFFNEKVFLVDCVTLDKIEGGVNEETWKKFGQKLLKAKNFKVVGFDLRNDIDAFLTIPAMKHAIATEEIRNTWCLKKLAERVCAEDKDKTILGLEKSSFTLADLAQKVADVKIDKSQQRSRWDYRPLRAEQLEYAAMDAVICVKLIEEIVELTKRHKSEEEVNQMMKDCNVMAAKADTSKKEFKKLSTLSWSKLYAILEKHRNTEKRPQHPCDIKIIVDTMLLGLGKNLRRLGIDVYIPTSADDFNKKLQLMARLGSDAQRHILTVRSKKYEIEHQYEKFATIFEDMTTKSAVEQLIRFIEEFNVTLRPEVEFHRCVECNSRYLVKFPSPVIHFLHQYNIVHMQNGYGSESSFFNIDKWYRRMDEINPEEYDNIEVRMSRPSAESSWIVATVATGCLHITRNTVIHTNLPDGVEVRIHKVPDDEFKRHNLSFFVCGECGTCNYDVREEFNDDRRN